MSEWKKVKIGDFLTEREGRYKPNDKEISKYQRLDKIDFSGHIHISDKPTKTDMIIVFPGDLIISGINVAKGAISVYQGKEPVCATIHYSSYTFDDKKVDLDYFKYFVKSPAFIFALQQQVKGGIKTEIKPGIGNVMITNQFRAFLYSIIVIFRSLFDQENCRNCNSHQFCDHNGIPDTVNTPNQG